MSIKLFDHQIEALAKMRDGCILCGGVGSGKSRAGIAYYFTTCGGNLDPYKPMTIPLKLYIITTARKRDDMEWEGDLTPFLLSTGDNIVVDSWNNIQKYMDVRDAFFIFDEQRVVGKGTWVKSFLKIAKNNRWILLSATPGDSWMDYVPVFLANGFYKNRTEFNNEHVKWAPYTSYPKVERYYNTGRLLRLRNSILINMKFDRQTVPHHIDIYTDYSVLDYKLVAKERWDKENDKPIETTAKLCYEMRKVVNSDPSRLEEVRKIALDKKKVIIFYNFDYELELLKNCMDEKDGFELGEWNGHKHQDIPNSEKWLYLVNYNAGAEGWNCIKTDTIIFYSQNYSYKVMVQSAGRIDRLNTPFRDLYFYHLKSRAGIDVAIAKALRDKKTFNETKYLKGGY